MSIDSDLSGHYDAVESALTSSLPDLPNGTNLQVRDILRGVAELSVEMEAGLQARIDAGEDPERVARSRALAVAGLAWNLDSLTLRLHELGVSAKNARRRAAVMGALQTAGGAVLPGLSGHALALVNAAIEALIERLK